GSSGPDCRPLAFNFARNLSIPLRSRSAGTVTGGTVNVGAFGADLPVGEIGAHLLRAAASWITITAAACGLEHDPVSDVQRRHQLGGHDLLAAAGAIDEGAGHRAVTPARATLRRDEVPLAAVGEADFAVQDLVFSRGAEAASLRAGAAGIATQGDAMDPDRRIELERLGRQVHAIRGVGLDHVSPVLLGARAGAASDQLAGYVVSAVVPHAAE